MAFTFNPFTGNFDAIPTMAAGIPAFLATPSSANLAAAVTDETGSGALVFGTAPTLGVPVIGDFTSAQHTHQNAAGGGTLDAAAIAAGVLPIARGGTNKALTLAAGGLVWTDADSFEVGAAGTSGCAAISGGTGAPTWFVPTAGSVLFAGTGGILAQDNANLFWDDANNRLGLSQTTPLAQLHLTHAASGYSDYANAQGVTILPGVIHKANIDANSFAGAATSFRGLHTETAVDALTDASRSVFAFSSLGIVPSTNATNLPTYTVAGAVYNATHQGTGTLGTVRGISSTTTRTASAGNVTTLNPLLLALTNNGTAGTVTTAVALDIGNLTNASTITDTIGIRIGDITTGTQTNAAYALQINDYNARNLIKNLYTDFWFVADPTSGGSYASLLTSNLAAQGTGQNQVGIILVSGVDATGGTPSYYGNPRIVGRLNATTAGEKQLGEIGWEGKWNTSSVLDTSVTHFYLWDAVNSRTMLQHRYSVGSETSVSDAGFGVWGYSDNSVISGTQLALAKNNSTTATYFSTKVTPTFNTGASNANTTYNVLWVDTVNTAVTGLTVNLLKLDYGAANKFLVSSAGTVTMADAANLVFGTTTGTKIGTVGGSSGQKIGFFNATPIVQPLLATGGGATVDNVITVLQNLGLCRQS
jgi:hypothetical protein